MPNSWTADQIISAGRRLYFAPEGLSTLGVQNADLLSMLNEYMEDELFGEIANVREDYFHAVVDTTLVASQSNYRINPRAIYQRLVDVNLFDSSGDQVPGFDRLDTAQIRTRSTTDTADTPRGYSIEGNYIRLYPALGSGAQGTLQQVFHFRPGELVLTANVRTIDSVNTATGAVVLSSAAPDTWSTSDEFDVHSKHSGAEVKAWDKAATSISGANMTITSVDGSVSGEKAVEAGDYVCLKGEAGLPGVPREFHSVLKHAVAVSLAEQMKDLDAVAVHKGTRDEKMRKALDNMKPRVDGDRKKIRGTRFTEVQGAWVRRIVRG